MVSRSSSGKGLAILSLIIGLVGIGMGLYSIMQIQTESSTNIIVGEWESLYRDMNNPNFNTERNWLIRVGDSEIYNSNYVNLDQTANHIDTRFHLIKSGWYRVNIIMHWVGTVNTYYYRLRIWKNDVAVLFPEYPVPEGNWYQMNTQFYISSDGNDYYEFNCYCMSDDFYMTSIQDWHQMTVEYCGEY